MKLLLTLPLLLCAAPLVPLTSVTNAPSVAVYPVIPVNYTGKVAGWSVSADGTVAVCLAGTHDGKEFTLWFATPASLNATTRYESLVLEAVLAGCGIHQDASITVTSRSGDQTAGKSVEDAMTLLSIARI